MLATACHTGSNHDRRTGLYRACKISKLLAVASSACMLQEKYERETRKGKAGREKNWVHCIPMFALFWEVTWFLLVLGGCSAAVVESNQEESYARCTSHILWCISIYLPLYLSCPCLPACVRVYGQACMYDNNGSGSLPRLMSAKGEKCS